MIEVEEITKKYSHVYRCPDHIKNFSIRVKLKDTDSEYEEVQIFQWQQKKYSKFERDFYKDVKNCVTDLEKTYHEDVKDLVENDDIISSYVECDDFHSGEENVSKEPQKYFNCFRIKGEGDGEDLVGKFGYDFDKSLMSAVENPYLLQDFENMFVVADFGEYYDDTWLKCEYVLCTLKYNKTKKIMIVYPDFTQVQPYVVRINTDSSKKIEFWLENASLDNANRQELLKEVEIFNKVALYDRGVRCTKIIDDFKLPGKNKLQVHIFLDILTAKQFERDNVYVQYYIDLPDCWTCADKSCLKGVTPSCSVKNGHTNEAFFGFPFDIALEYNIQSLQHGNYFQAPFIYFEVISKDTWNRYRTEGLTYKKIPISQPGMHETQLQCLRIAAHNPSGNLRRFFIGDCNNYDDITWLALPKNHQGSVMNRCGTETVSTGQLKVKMNVIHQSQAFIAENSRASREKFLMEKLNDSNLIKSVEQVLEAFDKARNNMLEARKKI